MDLGLRGRTILVTGATRGIGRACARALAAEGATLAVCARNAAALAELLAELDGRGEPGAAQHAALAVDLMDADGPARLLAWMRDRFATIYGVVHNLGGTLGVRDPLAPLAQWRDVWRYNLEIAIEINAALIPPMQAARLGRIVCLSSLAGFELHGSVPYSVIKAALSAYVRGIGRTYAADGIVAAAVVPGVVLTEGGNWDEFRTRDPERFAAYIRDRLPRGAFGTGEEIAAAVAFLCSALAGGFAGSIVPIDGGQGRSFFGQ
jgi:3-oxoacyl-[acyl-carrier protein] reductase